MAYGDASPCDVALRAWPAAVPSIPFRIAITVEGHCLKQPLRMHTRTIHAWHVT
jgi:hypothetical protein